MSNITIAEIESIRQEKDVLLAHDSLGASSKALYQNLATQQYTVEIVTSFAFGDRRETCMTLPAAVDAYNSVEI